MHLYVNIAHCVHNRWLSLEDATLVEKVFFLICDNIAHHTWPLSFLPLQLTGTQRSNAAARLASTLKWSGTVVPETYSTQRRELLTWQVTNASIQWNSRAHWTSPLCSRPSHLDPAWHQPKRSTSITPSMTSLERTWPASWRREGSRRGKFFRRILCLIPSRVTTFPLTAESSTPWTWLFVEARTQQPLLRAMQNWTWLKRLCCSAQE